VSDLKKSNIVIVRNYNTDLMSRSPHLPRPSETAMKGPSNWVLAGKV